MRRALLGIAVIAIAAAACAEQGLEPQLRRFALAYLRFEPGSAVTLTIDKTVDTWAGQYLLATALRTSALQKDPSGKPGNPEQLSMIVDPKRHVIYTGAVLPLSPAGAVVNKQTLPLFVEQALPKLLQELLNGGARAHWPNQPPDAPAFQVDAEIQTGYGWMKLPVAITADAHYLIVGGKWSLDRDPRAVRRDMLADATVQWDPGHDKAPLQIIEFSDYECPACKRGWSEAKPVIESLGTKARHGLVNFPLVAMHPWAFRAALAGLCVGKTWPDMLIPFKEELYTMQDTMTVSSVDVAVYGFLDKHNLDAKPFKACYLAGDQLSPDAIATVLKQLELGYSLGVLATPTYFVDGESVAFADAKAATGRLEAIIAAGGLPEKAK